jgi:hypothetical protein
LLSSFFTINDITAITIAIEAAIAIHNPGRIFTVTSPDDPSEPVMEIYKHELALFSLGSQHSSAF